MTLTSIKSELAKATKGGYAVPLFDVFEILGVEGLMDALIEKRAPTIMGIYSPCAAQTNCRAFAAYIRYRAEDTDVPISIMLDHGASVEQCLEVLKWGFSDVMYDGSKSSLGRKYRQHQTGGRGSPRGRSGGGGRIGTCRLGR